MKSDWFTPCALLICGVGFSVLVLALHKNYKESVRWSRKQTEAHRRNLDQSDQLLRQLKKSNRLLRKLIAEMQTARQAPEPLPLPELSHYRAAGTPRRRTIGVAGRIRLCSATAASFRSRIL